jgi:type I restriction enzyme, S subunit
MKQGWEIKSLGEIADVEYGFTDKSTEEGDYRYVRITDIDDNGELISTEKKYLKHSKEAKSFLLQDNDLLMARTGATFAKVLLYEDIEPSVFASYLIRIKFKEKIDNKLYWYFSKTKSYWEQANSLASGAAQPHFNGAAVKQVIFSYPKSLPEQQRIVSILDECFAAIDKALDNSKRCLSLSKDLFESYLQGVFENGNENWEVNCLDELGTITSSKRIYKSEYVKDGVPFYRTKEIKELSNGKPITLELFISRQRYEQIKQYFGVPKIGDLLMSAVGTIGEIMVIENEDEFYFKDGNIVWFKDFEKLDTNYLKYALTAFVEKIKSLAIGAAYSALTIEKLNKYQIAFPITIDEQQTIVRQLDALRAETQKLEAVYQKKIDDLEELKKSILQKAFAGELRSPEGAEYDSEEATPLAKKNHHP